MSRKTITISLKILSLIFIALAAWTFVFGLYYTGINNRFPWGSWMLSAQCLAAIGDGAFVAAFLFYIFRVDSLKPAIKPCLLMSLLSNIFIAVFMLLNTGQPLRLWYMFTVRVWEQNIIPASMLGAAFFSLLVYLCILCAEFIPTALTHRFFAERKGIKKTIHYMLKLIWILAAMAAFFGFAFHGFFEGKIWENLAAKPFWHREYLTLFFTGIAASAAGSMMSAFVLLTISAKVTGKETVPEKTFVSLSVISKYAFIIYFVLHIADICIMTLTAMKELPASYTLGGYYGLWVIIPEFCLAVAAIIFLSGKKPDLKQKYAVKGALCGILSILAGKIFITMQGFSIPAFPWDSHAFYWPGIIEVLTIITAAAFIILLYAGAVKRFKIFE